MAAGIPLGHERTIADHPVPVRRSAGVRDLAEIDGSDLRKPSRPVHNGVRDDYGQGDEPAGGK